MQTLKTVTVTKTVLLRCCNSATASTFADGDGMKMPKSWRRRAHLAHSSLPRREDTMRRPGNARRLTFGEARWFPYSKVGPLSEQPSNDSLSATQSILSCSG